METMRTPVEDPARGARSSSLVAPLLVSALVVSALVAPIGDAHAQSSDRSLVDAPSAGGAPSPAADPLGPIFEPVAVAIDGAFGPFPTADLSETSWDVPGQIVVDARD